MTVQEGDLLWQPSASRIEQTNIVRYMRWLAANGYGAFRSYDELWAWSVRDLGIFWESIWRFCDVQASQQYSEVLADRRMPGAVWFRGARLNFAEQLLRSRSAGRPAIVWHSESGEHREVSWAELTESTAAFATGLRNRGVRSGDRVVAVMPNVPETVIAFLAVVSIGAIWSLCSPDFGTASLIDRFKQLDPTVLIAVDGYRHKGRSFDRLDVIKALRDAIPTLRCTVLLPHLDEGLGRAELDGAESWRGMTSESGELRFEQLPADHPLWIVYTSGTTGLPKPIVHGHAGVLLERMKAVVLHGDVRTNDVYFWYTTTGWIMWNLALSALLGCSTIVLYDGSPLYPDTSALWRVVEATSATVFGASAAFIHESMRAQTSPVANVDLDRLRALGVTASPLSPEGYEWVYEKVKRDVWLSSSSGGTDVATSFVGGCPILPVHAGELQCRNLGVDVHAVDSDGGDLIDQVGELVVKMPMPSMPLKFWNDPDGHRYRESYFDVFPDMWRHGDWIKITSRGSAVIYGRSDSTINRRGIRIGTSDIYRAIEAVPGVADSLVLELDTKDDGTEVVLFVVLAEGQAMNLTLADLLRQAIFTRVSPAHVPDRIEVIPEVPRTLNGKKLEVPVKRILGGAPKHVAVTVGSVANPESLDYFIRLAGG